MKTEKNKGERIIVSILNVINFINSNKNMEDFQPLQFISQSSTEKDNIQDLLMIPDCHIIKTVKFK